MKQHLQVIELECGHILYLQHEPDTVDETLYCIKCGEYRELSPSVAKLRDVWVQHATEDFRSKRENLRKFLGECTVKNCTYSFTSWRGWFNLRDVMHKHYMRSHTRFGASDIKYEDITPTNPPF